MSIYENDPNDPVSPERESMLRRAAEIVANTSTSLTLERVTYWPDKRLQNWLDSWAGKGEYSPAATLPASLPNDTWRLPPADENKLEPWLPPSANGCRL